MPSFSLKARLKSVSHALDGIASLLASQHNARIHAAATIAVVCLGFLFGLEPWEWCAVILSVAVVWVAEALNTSIEFLCDVASPEFHPKVRLAKDVAAGGVLIASLGAASVGIVVFLPRIWAILGN